MRLLKWCEKSVAGSVAVCFFASLLLPSPIVLAQPETLPIASSFVPLGIPSELAKIEEAFIPDRSDRQKASEPPLIHIQSVHAHPETQRKIYALLKFLDEKYGIDSMFIEGAGEKLNPNYFRFFDDNRLNVRVAEKLVDKGELTGAELFLIESPRDIPAYGIEDPALYRRNLTSFQYVMRQRPATTQFTKGLRSSLDRLETLLLKKEARKLLRSREAFDSGQMELLSYALELERAARAILGVDIRYFESQLDWPQMIRLLRLQEIEAKLDPEKIQAERQGLVNYLLGIGVDQDLAQGFENLSFSPYQSGMVYDPGFRRNDLPRYLAERLVEATLEKGFAFEQYPDFTRYLEAAILQSELEAGRLFEEIERLFDKIMSAVSSEAEDKKFVGLVHKERLYERLFDLELTPKDYAKIQTENSEERPLIRFLLDLESLHEKTPLGKRKLIPANSDTLESIFGEARRFYELAKQREETMVEKILNSHPGAPLASHPELATVSIASEGSQNIDSSPRPAGVTQNDRGVTILITGGFHTAGLSHTFREKQIPYTILTPRITEKVNSEDYISALLGEKKTAFDTAHLEMGVRSEARQTLESMFPASTRQEMMRSEIRAVLQEVIETAARGDVRNGLLPMPGLQAIEEIERHSYVPDRGVSFRRSENRDMVAAWDNLTNEPFPNKNGKPIVIPLGRAEVRYETRVLEPRSLPITPKDFEREFGLAPRSELRATGATAEAGTNYSAKGKTFFISNEEWDHILNSYNVHRKRETLAPLTLAQLKNSLENEFRNALIFTKPAFTIQRHFGAHFKGRKKRLIVSVNLEDHRATLSLSDAQLIVDEGNHRLLGILLTGFPVPSEFSVDVADFRNRLLKPEQSEPDPSAILANLVEPSRIKNEGAVIFLQDGRHSIAGQNPVTPSDPRVKEAIKKLFASNPVPPLAIVIEPQELTSAQLQSALSEILNPPSHDAAKQRRDKTGHVVLRRTIPLDIESETDDGRLLNLLDASGFQDEISSQDGADIVEIGPGYLEAAPIRHVLFTETALKEMKRKARANKAYRSGIAGILRNLFADAELRGDHKEGSLKGLITQQYGAGTERVIYFTLGETVYVVAFRSHNANETLYEGHPRLEAWADEIRRGTFLANRDILREEEKLDQILLETVRLRVNRGRSELRAAVAPPAVGLPVPVPVSTEGLPEEVLKAQEKARTLELTREQRKFLRENTAALLQLLGGRFVYDLKSRRFVLLANEGALGAAGSFDIGVIPGSSRNYVASKAGEIFASRSRLVEHLFTVGDGPSNPVMFYDTEQQKFRPYTGYSRNGEPIAESEFFRQVLKEESGVLVEDKHVERKSRNTPQNIQNLLTMIDLLGYEPKSILIIHNEIGALRMLTTLLAELEKLENQKLKQTLKRIAIFAPPVFQDRLAENPEGIRDIELVEWAVKALREYLNTVEIYPNKPQPDTVPVPNQTFGFRDAGHAAEALKKAGWLEQYHQELFVIPQKALASPARAEVRAVKDGRGEGRMDSDDQLLIDLKGMSEALESASAETISQVMSGLSFLVERLEITFETPTLGRPWGQGTEMDRAYERFLKALGGEIKTIAEQGIAKQLQALESRLKTAELGKESPRPASEPRAEVRAKDKGKALGVPEKKLTGFADSILRLDSSQDQNVITQLRDLIRRDPEFFTFRREILSEYLDRSANGLKALAQNHRPGNGINTGPLAILYLKALDAQFLTKEGSLNGIRRAEVRVPVEAQGKPLIPDREWVLQNGRLPFEAKDRQKAVVHLLKRMHAWTDQPGLLGALNALIEYRALAAAVTQVAPEPVVYYVGLGAKVHFWDILRPLMMTDYATLIGIELNYISYDRFKVYVRRDLNPLIDQGTRIEFPQDLSDPLHKKYAARFQMGGRKRTIIVYYGYDCNEFIPNEVEQGAIDFLLLGSYPEPPELFRLLDQMNQASGFVIGHRIEGLIEDYGKKRGRKFEVVQDARGRPTLFASKDAIEKIRKEGVAIPHGKFGHLISQARADLAAYHREEIPRRINDDERWNGMGVDNKRAFFERMVASLEGGSSNIVSALLNRFEKDRNQYENLVYLSTFTDTIVMQILRLESEAEKAAFARSLIEKLRLKYPYEFKAILTLLEGIPPLVEDLEPNGLVLKALISILDAKQHDPEIKPRALRILQGARPTLKSLSVITDRLSLQETIQTNIAAAEVLAAWGQDESMRKLHREEMAGSLLQAEKIVTQRRLRADQAGQLQAAIDTLSRGLKPPDVPSVGLRSEARGRVALAPGAETPGTKPATLEGTSGRSEARDTKALIRDFKYRYKEGATWRVTFSIASPEAIVGKTPEEKLSWVQQDITNFLLSQEALLTEGMPLNQGEYPSGGLTYMVSGPPKSGSPESRSFAAFHPLTMQAPPGELSPIFLAFISLSMEGIGGRAEVRVVSEAGRVKVGLGSEEETTVIINGLEKILPAPDAPGLVESLNQVFQSKGLEQFLGAKVEISASLVGSEPRPKDPKKTGRWIEHQKLLTVIEIVLGKQSWKVQWNDRPKLAKILDEVIAQAMQLAPSPPRAEVRATKQQVALLRQVTHVNDTQRSHWLQSFTSKTGVRLTLGMWRGHDVNVVYQPAPAGSPTNTRAQLIVYHAKDTTYSDLFKAVEENSSVPRKLKIEFKNFIDDAYSFSVLIAKRQSLLKQRAILESQGGVSGWFGKVLTSLKLWGVDHEVGRLQRLSASLKQEVTLRAEARKVSPEAKPRAEVRAETRKVPAQAEERASESLVKPAVTKENLLTSRETLKALTARAETRIVTGEGVIEVGTIATVTSPLKPVAAALVFPEFPAGIMLALAEPPTILLSELRPGWSPKISLETAMDINPSEPMVDVKILQARKYAQAVLEALKLAKERSVGTDSRIAGMLKEEFGENPRVAGIVHQISRRPTVHAMVFDRLPSQNGLWAVLTASRLNPDSRVVIIFTPSASVTEDDLKTLRSEAGKILPLNRIKIYRPLTPDDFKTAIFQTAAPEIFSQSVVFSVPASLWNQEPAIGESLGKRGRAVVYDLKPSAVLLGAVAYLAVGIGSDALPPELIGKFIDRENPGRRYLANEVNLGALGVISIFEAILKGYEKILASA